MAQLLPTEEVQLNSFRMCGSIFLVFCVEDTFLLGSICCMQTYFYLEEVSRHCQSYLQRSTTRKMTGKYLYTYIVHEQ